MPGTVHTFGGEWTEQKLGALRRYLEAYRKIFSANENARFFKTLYIDAFAGTGERAEIIKAAGSLLDDHDVGEQTTALHKGSARIALELSEPFDEYIFVDKNADHADALRSMISESFPGLADRCQVFNANGIDVVGEQLQWRDWKRWRAVLFLDPYGMSVPWNLIRRIAETKAIDMWLLFPLGQGVNRLLSRDQKPNKAHAKKLTEVFGTEDWQSTFYTSSIETDLFGETIETVSKEASFSKIATFWQQRLATVFTGVCPRVLYLRNSKDNPIYLLCFAAGNERGSKTAIKIASDLLKADL
ncbi:three-Cys-motif partner protein TcmP [Paraburkholderia phenoliruptrix]|uniref:three-Cys-motif partner protein TcmP n=1 Tax=Paraburkholderia phenoliruptrix TaxID=252970 RepID=UPI001C4F3B39|nr:three-Cys-motif partner protein TcmP [Paraburkholderia phenoliruptrix]MBW0450872.1 three-Cys-motif partner protein TcmP [Paraburkholderia phenoliruptrix]MBW9100965.1 three-Cys-motif partner protein TcmP [Paraburkholderia phenoliruptrix]